MSGDTTTSADACAGAITAKLPASTAPQRNPAPAKVFSGGMAAAFGARALGGVSSSRTRSALRLPPRR